MSTKDPNADDSDSDLFRQAMSDVKPLEDSKTSPYKKKLKPRPLDLSKHEEDQDEFAYNSQMKAANAQKEGHFTEIMPTPAAKYALQENGTYKRETFIQKIDDGVRPTTTVEGLAGLRAVFAANGSVTAGNSSQTTDGAAATVIMSEDMVNKLGVKPIAKLKLYTTIGCEPDEMGVGPAVWPEMPGDFSENADMTSSRVATTGTSTSRSPGSSIAQGTSRPPCSLPV